MADGKIAKYDLTSASHNVKLGKGDLQIFEDLWSVKDQLFAGDHLCSKDEIEKIAKTGKMPDGSAAGAKVQAAAGALMNRPDLLMMLDNADRNGIAGKLGDDLFSKADFEKMTGRR